MGHGDDEVAARRRQRLGKPAAPGAAGRYRLTAQRDARAQRRIVVGNGQIHHLRVPEGLSGIDRHRRIHIGGRTAGVRPVDETDTLRAVALQHRVGG